MLPRPARERGAHASRPLLLLVPWLGGGAAGSGGSATVSDREERLPALECQQRVRVALCGGCRWGGRVSELVHVWWPAAGEFESPLGLGSNSEERLQVFERQQRVVDADGDGWRKEEEGPIWVARVGSVELGAEECRLRSAEWPSPAQQAAYLGILQIIMRDYRKRGAILTTPPIPCSLPHVHLLSPVCIAASPWWTASASRR